MATVMIDSAVFEQLAAYVARYEDVAEAAAKANERINPGLADQWRDVAADARGLTEHALERLGEARANEQQLTLEPWAAVSRETGIER